MQLSRRMFVKLAMGGVALAGASRFAHATPTSSPLKKETHMAFTLPPLPFTKDALEPHNLRENVRFSPW